MFDHSERFLCGRCRTAKPRGDFYPHPYNKVGIRKPCKECLRTLRRQRYIDKNGGDAAYDQLLRRAYGLTIEEYERKRRAQGGRCAICQRGETILHSGKTRRLSVDHDHVTGAVRDLLCSRCNRIVWAIEDNHTTIAAVHAYLQKWRETFASP